MEAVTQDALYEQVAADYGSALERLARAYELEPETCRDLLQEIHLRLWCSFALFDQRCSLRTWIYRVAHNVATEHVIRQRRVRDQLVSVEDIENAEDIPGSDQSERNVGQHQALVASLQADSAPEASGSTDYCFLSRRHPR